MTNIPISVIIPTYNRADRILNSINSVLNQTYRDLEVIIVDDGSTDNTGEVISKITDNRLRYHRLEENKGAANARNIGVALAKNSIIAFNDSDDIWHDNKLETQMEYWLSHQEHLLVYCPYTVVNPSGGSIQIPSQNEDPDTLCGDIFYFLLVRPTIGTPTMILEKELFLELGGFDVSCGAMEDWEFSLRVANMGTIGYVDKPLLAVEATAADRISNDTSYESKMRHYDTKCKVIAKYINEINLIGQFDLYAGEVFNQAQKDGVLDSVKEMMESYLKRSADEL